MLRIYLSGRMTIESDGELLGPQAFPGQQGRNAFAFLAGRRKGPVSRSELAEALWPGRPPPSWSTALSSIVSKLRSLLGRAGLDGASALAADGGCYELRLPSDAWIDHEAAAEGIHDAEAALKAGEPGRAYGPSAVALLIANRPFLAGEDARWIEECRERLGHILIRALECRAEVYLWNREYALALEAARRATTLQPFRETGYQLQMRAHAAAGNSAEALRAYEDCRALLASELGVDPSPQTRAVHAEILGSL